MADTGNSTQSHSAKDKTYHQVIGCEYHNVVVAPRQYANNLLFRKMAKHVSPGAAMLDIGCGTGHMLLRFAREFRNVTGVDHSPEMLASAAQNLADAGISHVDLVNSDLFSFIAKSDQKYDLITVVGCLHHIKHNMIKATVSSLRSKLSSRGILLLAEPVEVEPGEEPETIQAWNRVAVSRNPTYSRDVEEPDEAPIKMETIRGALVHSGFKVLCEQRAWDVLPKSTPPRLIDKIAIRYFQWRYGANGVVLALAATPK